MPNVPYKCPRCGYETVQKNSIRVHLVQKKKPCPAIENIIDLTHEIIEHILANRVYKIPKDKKTTIINNYNQVNNINNIVAGMDVIEKIEKYLSHKGTSLVDFESSVENKFKPNQLRLDKDQYKNTYFLKSNNLIEMVGKASEPSQNDKEPTRNHNIVFDSKLKEIKFFEGDCWEGKSLESGTKYYIERIQKNFLDSYERYLLRNLDSMSQGRDRAKFKEMLELYYEFIGCFDMEPFCKEANDDEIIRPMSCDEDEEDDNDSDTSSISSLRHRSYHEPTYEIQETYYPIYKKVVNLLTKGMKSKMIRIVQDAIKRNSAKNEKTLNKKITSLFDMDETFKDILLSIQN